MNLSKLPFCVAIAVLSCLQFSAPTASYADTYQIVSLQTDNRQFFGMDDSGHVVFYASFFSCGDPSHGCYETFLNGAPLGTSSIAPTYAWDYTAGTCVFPQPASGPCLISNNGRTADIAAAQPAGQSLFVLSGSNPPQSLVTALGIGGVFAINGLGDIVFDNQNLDQWYEAINTTPTAAPEPGSLLLLGTGAIALAGLIPRRKRA
jgi:hypothetical protein